MSGVLLKLFHAVVLLAPQLRASPLLEPIRCAQCTAERVAECPPVDAGCAEVLREPGCGCCLACALKRGDLCGIYTAPCGSGLRCLPTPGELRPLHALTRGQAVCTEIVEDVQSRTHHSPGRQPVLQNPFSGALSVARLTTDKKADKMLVRLHFIEPPISVGSIFV